MAYHEQFSVGSLAVWPNGMVGKVAAIDDSDDSLMDDCGGWHSAYDCDPAEQVSA